MRQPTCCWLPISTQSSQRRCVHWQLVYQCWRRKLLRPRFATGVNRAALGSARSDVAPQSMGLPAGVAHPSTAQMHAAVGCRIQSHGCPTLPDACWKITSSSSSRHLDAS